MKIRNPNPNAPGGKAPGLPPQLTPLKRRKKYRLRRRLYCAAVGVSEGLPEAVAATGSDAELLRLDKQKAEQERDDIRDQMMRARADLENQRRRFQKEKEDLRKFATEDLMRSLLPAMDHFALALESLNSASDVKSVTQGITMIHRELTSTLKNGGLVEINPIHQPFDPNHHEAVGTDADPAFPDGLVLEVMRSGWSLNDRVLRPAMVKVNKLDSAVSSG